MSFHEIQFCLATIAIPLLVDKTKFMFNYLSRCDSNSISLSLLDNGVSAILLSIFKKAE